MQIAEKLKRVLTTGKATLGAKQSINELINGKSKLIVLSNNCPKETKEIVDRYAKQGNVPVTEFEGTSLQLGELTGKPYLVAVMSVTDLGEVTVKELTAEKKK